MNYKIIRLTDSPEMMEQMANWFHEKWGIPKEAYIESMQACLSGVGAVPQWYAVLDGERNLENLRIIGGAGVIENDFHDRPDLTPNICALFVEPDRRFEGIAGKILQFVCNDMKDRGLDTLYLVTDHDSFYERYGWQYLCPVQSDGEPNTSRMYMKGL